MSDRAELQALIDLEAIRNLARCYADCVWRRDADGAVALFMEDGVMDLGDRPPLEGHQAMLEAYRPSFAESEFKPFVHNHVVDLQGDVATGRCYLDLKAIVDGNLMEGWGFYEDHYARHAQGWRFQSRRLNLVHFSEASPD
jgi:ketosteroid isomerase-like protein